MSTKPTRYQIRIKGHLDERWTLWFDGLTIHRTLENDEPVTSITGPVVDQAALYGTLNRLRDLGMTLISAQQIDNNQEDQE